MVKHHATPVLLENICHCCPLAEISAEQHKKSRFLLSSSLLWWMVLGSREAPALSEKK
jgi:hypothetical protein